MRNVLYLYYARRSHAIILYFTRKILIWMQYIIQKNARYHTQVKSSDESVKLCIINVKYCSFYMSASLL